MSIFRKKMNDEEVMDFIRAQSPETKIYIGGDSERHKVRGVWYADYAVCAVVHINGKNGCRVFGEVVREVDYDKNKNAPRMRLMTEVYKIADLCMRLKDSFGDRHFEVHLDINGSAMHGSNIVMNEAIGYIRATCNVIPMIKPNSPAASFCADKFAEIKQRSAEIKNGQTIRQLSASKLKRRRKYGG